MPYIRHSYRNCGIPRLAVFPDCMSDMFHPKSIKVQTRNSILQLSKPSSKASGHKGIAYLAPSIWNELPSDMKLIPNLNTFKHKLKRWFLENLKKEEQNIYSQGG